MFLLTRDGFLNHCPITFLVICQPRRKFDMLTFVVSHIMCSILFFMEHKRCLIFKAEMKLEWNYERVVLLISEILWKYYSIESREGKKTLENQPQNASWYIVSVYIFLFCFCGICIHQYVGNKRAIWKFMFVQSTLTAR